MNAIINTLENRDLYGPETVFLMLKKHYQFVSIRDKSVPTLGSPTYKVDQIKHPELITEISRFISHKNNSVTIVTNLGYLQFTNL